MSLFHDDGQAVFHLGDVREVLRGLPAESVDMCVTSPPYWSLRDYGVEPSVWGGGTDGYGAPCGTHIWVSTDAREAYTGNKRWQHVANGRGELQGGVASELGRDVDHRKVRELEPTAWGSVAQGQFCRVCGAWRGALGLEPTPGLFVAHIVEVFREVRRVLKPGGTLWLNIGDSYAGSWGAQSRGSEDNGTSSLEGANPIARGQIRAAPTLGSKTGARGIGHGLKAKDLVGIPWMVAFALRADGWWLRQDIIWSKPNPMPESVRDRCTKSHEYLFLLSKSERYYSDFGAIREPASPNTNPRASQAEIERVTELRANGANTSDAGIRTTPKSAPARSGIKANESYHHAMALPVSSRNKRSVWSIPTAPYAKAHFATFPPALVEPTIKAGCPEGGVVLDPFLGSGTTAMVARRLGRRVVGIDLNAEYLAMAVERMGAQLSMDAELGAVG